MAAAIPAPLVLLTRPERASREVAARLIAAGAPPASVIVAPLMETEGTGAVLDPARYAGLVFTSGEGVERAARAAPLRGRRAYCVGDRTAELARSHGMDAVSAGGTVDDLVALLVGQKPAGRLVHARGEDSLGDLAHTLARAGIDTDDVVLYRQVERPLPGPVRDRLAGAGLIVAPSYSALSTRRLAACLAGLAARVHLVAMSPAVAEAWPDPPPARILTASRPVAAEVERLILETLSRHDA